MAKKTNYTKNGIEYYRITKTIGHKEDGTPVKKEFYGNSKSEAEEKANKYINDLKNGLIQNAENYTVSQLMKIWLFDFLHNSVSIKPSTFQRYEGIYRNYVKSSTIAWTKITKLNSVQIQNYYNDLSKDKSYSQISISKDDSVAFSVRFTSAPCSIILLILFDRTELSSPLIALSIYS